jgi:hypothetical protein
MCHTIFWLKLGHFKWALQPKSIKLEDIFCLESNRTVQNDWIISHESKYYQILKDNKPLPRPKDKVLVRIRLDGSVHLLFKGKELKFKSLGKHELEQRTKKPITKRPRTRPGTPMPQKGHKPAADHPWAGKGRQTSTELER